MLTHLPCSRLETLECLPQNYKPPSLFPAICLMGLPPPLPQSLSVWLSVQDVDSLLINFLSSHHPSQGPAPFNLSNNNLIIEGESFLEIF